jgi:hypothetical protein
VTLQEFRDSLKRDAPPPDLSPALTSLWWDANGDWAKAHEAAQADEGPAGAWVHAYLHRKEGDLPNAAYWYARAGKPGSRAPLGNSSLEEEWSGITAALLGTPAGK